MGNELTLIKLIAEVKPYIDTLVLNQNRVMIHSSHYSVIYMVDHLLKEMGLI